MRVYLFLLSISFVLNASAQIPDYFEEAQTWNMIFQSSSGCQQYAIYVDNDTIIGQHTYKRIGRRGIQFPIGPGNPGCSGGLPVQNVGNHTYAFLRQSADSIFEYNTQTNADQLLISYNLLVGDSISFQDPSFITVVDSIDTVQLNGASHRRFFVGGFITMIEGFLFSDTQFTLPLTYDFHGVTIAGIDVICFEENGLVVWPANPNCDHIDLSVQNDLLSTNLFVHPNPASDLIQLEIPDTETNTKVHVYDLGGTVVLTASNVQQLDVSQLPVGTYLLELRGNSVLRTRVVVAR